MEQNTVQDIDAEIKSLWVKLSRLSIRREDKREALQIQLDQLLSDLAEVKARLKVLEKELGVANKTKLTELKGNDFLALA